MVNLDRLKDIRVEDLPRHARDFWHWWTSELSGMVPDKWRGLLRDDSGVVTVDVLDKKIVVSRSAGGTTTEVLGVGKEDILLAAPRQTVKRSILPADRIIVRVPRGELLTRLVHLPLTASRNLKNILKFELERVSPLDPAQVTFDYRVVQRDKDANRIDVELRILRRDVADSAVQAARNLGLEPDALDFAGSEIDPRAKGFPVGGAASLRSHWRAWQVPALSALAVFLGIAALLATYSRQQEGLDELSTRMTTARVRAHGVEVLQDQIDKAKLGMAFLGKQKQSPLLVEVLAEVTRILPDRTWLVQFELHGKEVRVEGYSNAASSLIARIDNSRLFSNAQFRSSLTRGPAADLERFDLSFEIKDRAG